jgi:hypothetical protein
MLKASLTLSGSFATIIAAAQLLEDNGFGDLIPGDNADGPMPVVTPPVAAAAAAQGTELDATGLPWDERIHAGSKSRKADGSWTRKRGVDDATFMTVEAELRAHFPNVPASDGTASVATVLPVVAASPVAEPIAAPVMAPQPVPMAAPVPVAVPTGTPTLPMAPQPVPMAPVPTAPVPVMAPQPVPVAQPAPSGPPTNINELMLHLDPLMDVANGGTVTPEYLHAVIGEINTAWGPHLGGKTIGSIADLAAFPDQPMVQWVWQVFQRDGKVA